MDTLNRETLHELAQHQEYPCVSLLMPTHRMHPEKAVDPLTFKNLVKDLKNALAHHAEMLAPLEKLQEDRDFWNYQDSGLAIFLNSSIFKIFSLPVEVPSLAIVADNFHVKPLYRYIQENIAFQLLVVNQNDVALFEGDCHYLKPIELAGKVPLTMVEALGSELTDNHLNTAFSTGNGSRKQANQGTGNVVHGYLEKSSEQQNDAERFFRVVDKAVYEHFSKPSNLPLILASLPEHQTLFRKSSKNPLLINKGITQNAADLSPERLKELACDIITPIQQKLISDTLERQQAAEQYGRSHWKLKEVVEDALDGKIETLLIEEDKIIPGRILAEERRIDTSREGTDDILDDLAALVVEKAGNVLLLTKEEMPHDTGAVSINRF
ncbi:baeRF3 domain-containing protein [Sphingobacterium sp. SYP-B4668]|uniref:baeRF3 domain-containing protein n=1 Tax=Sphingobacterium sp. SYP-B4668 TaxID=2996035 RepID=UPI0022DE0938|nr:hypothetical protein [Sphingobacterium sp. SYP-B4668]